MLPFGFMYETYLSKLVYFLVMQEVFGPISDKKNCSFLPELGGSTASSGTALITLNLASPFCLPSSLKHQLIDVTGFLWLCWNFSSLPSPRILFLAIRQWSSVVNFKFQHTIKMSLPQSNRLNNIKKKKKPTKNYKGLRMWLYLQDSLINIITNVSAFWG